eukprot:gene10912-24365_t
MDFGSSSSDDARPLAKEDQSRKRRRIKSGVAKGGGAAAAASSKPFKKSELVKGVRVLAPHYAGAGDKLWPAKVERMLTKKGVKCAKLSYKDWPLSDEVDIKLLKRPANPPSSASEYSDDDDDDTKRRGKGKAPAESPSRKQGRLMPKKDWISRTFGA